MTTASTTTTVNDYKHPEWCDLTKCEPDVSRHDDAPDSLGGLHASAGTTWAAQCDEVEFKVALGRFDEMLDGHNHGRTFLHLHMLAQNNATPGYADAWLSPAEVAHLIASLQAYAKRLKCELLYPAGSRDLPAGELPRHL